MFNINPFAELSATISPAIMQIYLICMIILVVGGTLFDVIHKGSAKYFFTTFKKSREEGKAISARTKAGVAVKTIASDVLTSSELCGWKRRTAHLLGMYGFVINVVATFMMVMFYVTPEVATPAIWPKLWSIGAIMVCVGTSWFWFFIRVDVHAEGHSPFRLVRADLFVVSLLLSATFGLLWAYFLTTSEVIWGNVFLAFYLLATTTLFGSIPWSKFSHMFFKPAAAFQKKIATADGSRSNLPAPSDNPSIYGSSRNTQQNY